MVNKRRFQILQWIIIIALGLTDGRGLGSPQSSPQAGDRFVEDYQLDVNEDGIQDFNLKGLFKLVLSFDPINGSHLESIPLDYWLELSPTAHPTNAFILPRPAERTLGHDVFTVDWLDDQCPVVHEMSPYVRFMAGDGVHYGTLLISSMPPTDPKDPEFHQIFVFGFNPVPNEGFIAFETTPPLVIRVDPAAVPPVIRWYGDRTRQQGTKQLEVLNPTRDGIWTSLGPPTSGREWKLDSIPTNSLFRVISN